jgi:hypothetical protein
VSTLISRLSTENAVHELVRRDGSYVLRTYVPAPAFERELTLKEAGEWVDTTLRCGGESFARLGSSLKIPERTDT